LANLTKIKVLGTAQDAGHPQLNCSCEHCQQARKDKSLTLLQSSIAAADLKAKKTFIFDATPAFSEQLDRLNEFTAAEKMGAEHLSGIFLTHAHLGHYTGLMYLGKEALNTSDFPVYLSQKMLDFLKSNAPWSDIVENNLKPIVFNFEEDYQLTENISFRAVEVEHRNEHADTAGFIVKAKDQSFFYLPDFDSWSSFADRFIKILKEVDYAFIDGTFFDRKELGELRGRELSQVPHPPILESMELLADLDAAEKQKIYFTHFNHTNRIFDQDGIKKKLIKKNGFNILESGKEFK